MHSTLTSKARLAVAVMTDLASQPGAGPVALALISARQDISLSYLQQIVGSLRRHALVQAVRGPGGGYSLGRRAEEISLADIISAVDSQALAEPHDAKARRLTGRGDYGASPDMWAILRVKLLECLGAISLKDLVGERAVDLRAPAAPPPARRGISSQPVLRPIRLSTPNSVFALGAALSK